MNLNLVNLFAPTRARDFLVVEVKRLTTDDLIIFVALARDQNEIAAARFGNRLVNRLRAIGDLPVRLACLLNSLFGVAKDLLRIFQCADCRK